MYRSTILVNKIKSYIPTFDSTRVVKACAFAKKAHENQIRASGEPYYQHPFLVAVILAEMHLDEDSIITALLHDTVEDTEVSLSDIKENFGDNIARLVDGVTKLAKIKFQPDNIREGENFRKLLMAMSEDIRVLIVKLADRLHNMRTIDHLSEKKAFRIALETMEIYSPLAERIGMQKMKNELQDIAFAKLHPEERASIINRLKFLKEDEGLMVDKIETHIKKTIADFGIEADVSGREKTPCSIWQKMKQKDVSFEQLSDIIAFRVVVNDVTDCYQILGIIHAAYHMIPGSFKDYISTPKDNGYSSLHTVVVGPNKQRIEIQIRTKEMNDVNEWGVAAHWCYKQEVDLSRPLVEGKQFRWLRELLKILENSETEEFIEHTKLEMYEDQVFCFTPKGELVALPKGATSLDFAYALHSDLGNTCIGCKINGRVVPIKTKLENGDQVEISNSKNQVPSVTWKKFVVTAKAKAEIKRFTRLQQRKEYISLGKGILSKLFSQEGKEFSEDNLRGYLTIFHKKNLSDFYSAVGEGTISREDVLNATQKPIKSKLKKFKEKFSFLRFKKKEVNSKSSLSIKGMNSGTAVKFAICCSPIPGDQIIGVFEDDKGITVHTADCHMIEEKEILKKSIEVSWGKDNKDSKHTARLKITLSNSPNALLVICDIVAKQNCNISNLKLVSRTDDFFEMLIDIEVLGSSQLSNIIASLRSKECIYNVERSKSYI